MDGSGSSPVELGDALQSMQQQVHGVRRGQEERKFSAEKAAREAAMNPKFTASPKRRKAEKSIGGPDDPLLAKARALTTAADTMEFPDFGDMFGGKYSQLAAPAGATSPARAGNTRRRGGNTPSRVAHSPISSREAPGGGEVDALPPPAQTMASPTMSPDRTRGPAPPAQPRRRRGTQRKWAAATTKPIAVPEGTTLADAAAAAHDAAQDAARALRNGNALVAGHTAHQGAGRAPPRPSHRPASGREATEPSAAPAAARQAPAAPPSDYDRRIQRRIAAKKREKEARRKAEEEAEERKRAQRARDEERAAAYRARLARRVQEEEEKRRQRERAKQREAAERKRREEVEAEERARRVEASRRAAAQRARRQWAEKHGEEERREAEAELEKQLRDAKNAEEGSAAAQEAKRRVHRTRERLRQAQEAAQRQEEEEDRRRRAQQEELKARETEIQEQERRRRRETARRLREAEKRRAREQQQREVYVNKALRERTMQRRQVAEETIYSGTHSRGPGSHATGSGASRRRHAGPRGVPRAPQSDATDAETAIGNARIEIDFAEELTSPGTGRRGWGNQPREKTSAAASPGARSGISAGIPSAVGPLSPPAAPAPAPAPALAPAPAPTRGQGSAPGPARAAGPAAGSRRTPSGWQPTVSLIPEEPGPEEGCSAAAGNAGDSTSTSSSSPTSQRQQPRKQQQTAPTLAAPPPARHAPPPARHAPHAARGRGTSGSGRSTGEPAARGHGRARARGFKPPQPVPLAPLEEYKARSVVGSGAAGGGASYGGSTATGSSGKRGAGGSAVPAGKLPQRGKRAPQAWAEDASTGSRSARQGKGKGPRAAAAAGGQGQRPPRPNRVHATAAGMEALRAEPEPSAAVDQHDGGDFRAGDAVLDQLGGRAPARYGAASSGAGASGSPGDMRAAARAAQHRGRRGSEVAHRTRARAQQVQELEGAYFAAVRGSHATEQLSPAASRHTAGPERREQAAAGRGEDLRGRVGSAGAALRGPPGPARGRSHGAQRGGYNLQRRGSAPIKKGAAGHSRRAGPGTGTGTGAGTGGTVQVADPSLMQALL